MRRVLYGLVSVAWKGFVNGLYELAWAMGITTATAGMVLVWLVLRSLVAAAGAQ